MMLQKPVVQAFVCQAHKKSLPAKHTVIHAGDEPHSLYLILEGSVSVVLEDHEGREVVLAYLNPGEFFGEMGLFPEHNLRSAVVRTRSQALVAEFSYAGFRRFVRDYPEIMFELSGQMACRLRDLNQRVANLAFMDVAGRLTHALLELSKKPDAVAHPSGIVVRISRQELARHVGCSREMAGRVLKKLKNEGFVHSQGRNILIYRNGQNGSSMMHAAA